MDSVTRHYKWFTAAFLVGGVLLLVASSKVLVGVLLVSLCVLILFFAGTVLISSMRNRAYAPSDGKASEVNYFAYSFQSAINIAEMLSRLNEAGHGQWHQRDKDAWGDYLFGRLSPDPYSATVNIFAPPDAPSSSHYVANVKFRPQQPDGEAEYQAVREALLSDLRSVLGASRVRRTEYEEW